MKKLIFLLLTGVFSLFAYADIIISPAQTRLDSECSKRIKELERIITELKEKIESLENKSCSSADTWICVYRGFGMNDEYTATGPTKSIAALRAREKCKKNDVSNGFYCKEGRCYQ